MVAANILNKEPLQTTRGGRSAGRLGVRLTILHRKNTFVTNILNEPRTWKNSVDKRHKRRNIGIRFGL
jgi:hypothetical protein